MEVTKLNLGQMCYDNVDVASKKSVTNSISIFPQNNGEKSTEEYIDNGDGTYTIITNPHPYMCGGQVKKETYNNKGQLIKEVKTSGGTDKPYTWTTRYHEDGTYTVVLSNDEEGKDVQWVKHYNNDGSLIK